MQNRKSLNLRPQDVIKVLNQAGVDFVLVGAYGIAGWLDEPRASQDVDLLLPSKKMHSAAVQAVSSAFPSLIVQHLPSVTRFLEPKQNLSVIDLIKSQAALHRRVPKNAKALKNTQNPLNTHKIPTLEMALALKYAAMRSPDRTLKKQLQDKADFIGMVTRNHEIIDEAKLKSLVRGVRPGSESEVIQLVNEAQSQGDSTLDN